LIVDLNDIIEVNGTKLKIIGFLESIGNDQDDSQVYVTNNYFEKLLPEKDSYAEIIVRVDISKIDKVAEDIERNLRKHRDLEKGKEDFFVQSFDDMLESYSTVLNIIIGFIILIALISIFVSAINTSNTMITSVLERVKEIGILKSIGAQNSRIFGIFLFESSFLGIVAGILGVVFGFFLTSVGYEILKSLGFGFLKPYHPFSLFLGLVLFAGLTGAISGALPALRASKQNPVDALRYE